MAFSLAGGALGTIVFNKPTTQTAHNFLEESVDTLLIAAELLDPPPQPPPPPPPEAGTTSDNPIELIDNDKTPVSPEPAPSPRADLKKITHPPISKKKRRRRTKHQGKRRKKIREELMDMEKLKLRVYGIRLPKDMFIVENVLALRLNLYVRGTKRKRRHPNVEALVKWEGFSDDKNTWEAFANVQHISACKKAVALFCRNYVTTASTRLDEYGLQSSPSDDETLLLILYRKYLHGPEFADVRSIIRLTLGYTPPR